jgi:hypothetical protein
MNHNLASFLRLAATIGFGLTALSAQAGGSSASSASSESIGSVSTSIGKSSDSSSGKDKVAQGQYKITEMAEVAQQPDMVRVRLQGIAAAQTEEFFLTLPRHAAERGQLAEGQVVEAQHRPFGLAFAALDTTGNVNPFFLVLDDAWHRELESRPVVL